MDFSVAPSAIRFYNLGNVDHKIYRLVAGVMSGCHHFTTEIIRLYEMKANSVHSLLATRNHGATANMGSAASFNKPIGHLSCKNYEKPEDPGDLNAKILESYLFPSQVSIQLQEYPQNCIVRP